MPLVLLADYSPDFQGAFSRLTLNSGLSFLFASSGHSMVICELKMKSYVGNPSLSASNS
jgi:hypothetical protein